MITKYEISSELGIEKFSNYEEAAERFRCLLASGYAVRLTLVEERLRFTKRVLLSAAKPAHILSY